VSLTFVVDVTLGLLAVIAASVLQRRVNRRPPMDLDDEVVARDLASALRAWGAAITILGLLALSGLPGGFDQPLWSMLALAMGAIGATVIGVRWRWEGWALGGDEPTPDRPIVESETWQFALLLGGGTTFAAYFIGLSIGLMQPVHATVAVLEGIAGGALGYALWTPRTKITRRPTQDVPPLEHRSVPRRRRTRR
jgi:hypothetical protein